MESGEMEVGPRVAYMRSIGCERRKMHEKIG